MATWLYQLSVDGWSHERYRIEVCEGQRWRWGVGQISAQGQTPVAGDIVVFFYAPTNAHEPGFYGWAIILDWVPESRSQLYFLPTAPSDALKMCPWWDERAKQLADDIRGKVKQKTFWLIDSEMSKELRRGMITWLYGHPSK